MKKIILFSSFLLISAFAFGQSVTILPNKTTNQSNTDGENINVTANSNSLGIYGRRFNGTFASKTPVLNGNELFRVSAGGFWGSVSESQHAAIKFNATENWGSGSGTKISFTTTPNAGTSQVERMVINHDGNVGIGASTPLEKLHVGAASASSLAKFTNNFTGHTASDGLHIGLVYGNFLGEFTYSQIMNRENTNLYLGTNNLNRMTIENTGKVGIGITLPLDQLHLNATDGTGDVFTRISSTTGFTGLRLQNLGGDWQLFSSEFDKLFLDYSPDNFANRTGVLIFEPNGANFNMMPTTTNTVFLGTSANRWREIWSQNALNTSSDRRLKKNIVEIKYGLDEIMKLQAVSYNWKNMNDPKLQLGFIAQDVEKIVPEIVSKSGISDEEFAKLEQKGETVSDTYGMQYTGLIPVLVKAVQEQQKIIEAKSLKISQLEEKLQKMEGLEARLSVIESSLNVKKASQEVKADK